MSRTGKAFELGGIVVPVRAALKLTQQIEPVGGSSTRRLGAGSLIKQTVWRKTRITLSGAGWCPIGVGALNWDAQLVLKCGLPEGITSNTTTITLPAGRRTDAGYQPFARAHLAGEWQDTPVSIAGNVATVTAVAGAIAYQVWYWPVYTVYAEPPVTSVDKDTAQASWELVCEEV